METDPEKYLAECVRIEPMAIQEEFVRVPADLAYWSDRYAFAYEAWNQAKLVTEHFVAETSMILRDKLEGELKKRVTAAEVEHHLHAMADYLRVRQQEASAEANKIRLYGIVNALNAKKEMLISLGAQMRAEMGQDPMVRSRYYVEGEVRSNR